MVFSFNSFQLDPVNASLRRGKQAVVLTPKAFNVLRYLLEHVGQLVSKDDLWRAVWPGTSVTDAALTNCVSELRKALGDDPKAPRYVETMHRLGYRFIAPVSTQPVQISESERRRPESGLILTRRSPAPHCVGREAESAQLQESLGRALESERQIVFVTGEPGIGKTALVDEFLQQAQATAGESLWIGRGQCIEHYGAGEAYLPLLDALGRLCRQPEGGRLLQILDHHAPTWLVHMPALLGAAERKELQEKAAGATHARMLRELADAMEVITTERPLVLRLEDLHWSDYSTLDWLGFLARRQEAARLLVIGTYRPVEVIVRDHPLRNLKHELQIHGQCRELSLPLLNEAAVTEYLTRRFVAPADSNTSTRQQRGQGVATERLRDLARTIYRRTDGNPLFMVNVVEYLIEHEVLKTLGTASAAQARIAPGPDSINIPSSIVEMIEHNLDRLNPDEQRVLEAASVAGGEFSAAAIAAALGRSVDESEACCARLSRRHQFLRTLDTNEWPDGTMALTFRFQHSLYEEVLHQRLPAGHRVELHRRIAERLEIAWGEHTEEIAAELGQHFTEAGLSRQAIPYWQRAGQRAIDRSANIEAIGHFTKALELLKSTPDSIERAEQELLLQIALGRVLMALKGYAALEVGKAYARALDLCRQIGDTPRLFSVLAGLTGFNIIRGELVTARELVEQGLLLAQKRQVPMLIQAAHYGMGEILECLGELYDSRTHLEQAIALSGPMSRRRSIHDTHVGCLAIAAHTLWALGYPEQALKRTGESLTLARQLSHPFALAFALNCAAGTYERRRDLQATQEHAEVLIALSREHGFTLREARGVILRGWALAKQGAEHEAIRQMREAVAAIQDTGARLWQPYFVALIIEACGKAIQAEEGITALKEALDVMERTGTRTYEPRLYLLMGEVSLMQTGSGATKAEKYFRRAIEVASRQRAKSWELRATVSLARLLTKQGRHHEGHAMLADIYNWFTEGFDTLDLKEAKALLDELAS